MGGGICQRAVVSDEATIEIGKSHWNLCSALQSVGLGHSSTTQTFPGSMLILPVEMMYPRKAVEEQENSHFSALTNSLFSRRCCRNLRRWRWCSSGSFEKMSMSSRYTKTNWLIISLRTSLTRAWKTVGAFVNPNGITRYSQ